MKKMMTLVALAGLGLFTVGCGPRDDAGTGVGDTPATTPGTAPGPTMPPPSGTMEPGLNDTGAGAYDATPGTTGPGTTPGATTLDDDGVDQ